MGDLHGNESKSTLGMCVGVSVSPPCFDDDERPPYGTQQSPFLAASLTVSICSSSPLILLYNRVIER